jgi:hypothetical protein
LPEPLAAEAMRQPQTEEQNRVRLRQLRDRASWSIIRSESHRFTIKTYGPVVLGMPFTEPKQSELLRLLAARWDAAGDALRAQRKSYADLRKKMRRSAGLRQMRSREL